MRKIEKSMVQAVRDRRSWSEGNTNTVPCVGCVRVYLFNHEIARVMDDGEVFVNMDTLREWPTATTLSRLRALGVDVFKSAGIVYVDGVRPSQWVVDEAGTAKVPVPKPKPMEHSSDWLRYEL